MRTKLTIASPLRSAVLGVIILSAFALSDVTIEAQTASRPVKLGITASTRTVANGTAVDVTLSLRDPANMQVPAPHDLKGEIEARESSGVQRLPVIIKSGSSSGRCSFPLHEGGIIEIWATAPEVRPATVFVRVKPFTAVAPEPAQGFIPYSPTGTAGTQASGTHFGHEVGKVGETAGQIGTTAQTVHDTAHLLGNLFDFGKPGTEQPAILAGSEGRNYLADNTDSAVIQVFLTQPVAKRTEIQLASSGGKLSPPNVIVESGNDTGQTEFTSDKTGRFEVKFVKAAPKIKQAPTNSLVFSFKPPIVRLGVRASPPKISLLDTTELVVQLDDAHGNTVPTDEALPISATIVSGKADLDAQEHSIATGQFETRISFRPTGWGTVRIKAFAANLSAETVELQVALPILLLTASGLGGSLGGLLAAFQSGLPLIVKSGPLRRRLKNLPWWRMGIGLVTGFVLYWTFLFLPFSIVPKGVLLNPFSAAVCSLLGGWLGLNVFSLVLKRLGISPQPVQATAPLRNGLKKQINTTPNP